MSPCRQTSLSAFDASQQKSWNCQALTDTVFVTAATGVQLVHLLNGKSADPVS